MLRTTTDSPIRWIGGKSRLIDWITSYFPPHDVYLEPFGGGAAVLLNKIPCTSETYNDIDCSLVNFFRVLKDASACKKLQDVLEFTPYARAIYEEAAEKLVFGKPGELFTDPVDWAAAFFVATRQSISGIPGNTWGKGYVCSTTAVNFNIVSQLQEFGKRMRMVQIENRDAMELMTLDDSPELLCYCDPPYMPDTRVDKKTKQYQCDVDINYHKKLLDLVLSMKARVLLSGYPNELYHEKLTKNGWTYKEKKVVCLAAARTKTSGLQGAGNVLAEDSKMERTESLWINPQTISSLSGAPGRQITIEGL